MSLAGKEPAPKRPKERKGLSSYSWLGATRGVMGSEVIRGAALIGVFQMDVERRYEERSLCGSRKSHTVKNKVECRQTRHAAEFLR